MEVVRPTAEHLLQKQLSRLKQVVCSDKSLNGCKHEVQAMMWASLDLDTRTAGNITWERVAAERERQPGAHGEDGMREMRKDVVTAWIAEGRRRHNAPEAEIAPPGVPHPVVQESLPPLYLYNPESGQHAAPALTLTSPICLPSPACMCLKAES